mgnify:CR=1 FL=1
MQKILVDTSSIVFSFSNKKDIFDELKEMGFVPVISQGVVSELEKLANSRRRPSAGAGAALLAIRGKGIETDKDRRMPDIWLLSSASKGVYICTNDRRLKQRLEKKLAKVVSVGRDGKLRNL